MKKSLQDVKNIIGEPDSHKHTDWDDKCYSWTVGDGEVSVYTLLNNEPCDMEDVFPLDLEMYDLCGELETIEQLIDLKENGTLDWWNE